MNTPINARIPSIPDTITRDQAVQACEVLGLDPNYVQTIHLEPECVSVKVYAMHPDHDGRILGGEKFLTITADVPVVDDTHKETTP